MVLFALEGQPSPRRIHLYHPRELLARGRNPLATRCLGGWQLQKSVGLSVYAGCHGAHALASMAVLKVHHHHHPTITTSTIATSSASTSVHERRANGGGCGRVFSGGRACDEDRLQRKTRNGGEGARRPYAPAALRVGKREEQAGGTVGKHEGGR